MKSFLLEALTDTYCTPIKLGKITGPLSSMHSVLVPMARRRPGTCTLQYRQETLD